MADDTLRGFAHSLNVEAGRLPAEVRAVVKKGAQNLKDDYAREAEGSTHFSSVAPAWSYDMSGNAFFSAAEVGPNKGRAGGALANLYYFGSPRGGGGTGDIDGPLDREQPRMMKALDDLLGGLL